MSYVKPNGTLGFAAGEEGQKLGYAGYRCFNVKCIYDPATDQFFAIWLESSTGQTSWRVVTQRVSKTGELQYDENGLEIEPYIDRRFGEPSLQIGLDGEIACFYMKRNTNEYGNVDNRLQLVNTASGTTVWDEPYVYTQCDKTTQKTDLASTSMANNRYWVTSWFDKGAVSDANYKLLMMQRVNRDRTIGNPESDAVTTVTTDKPMFAPVTTVATGEAMFAVQAPKLTQATLVLYDMNGKAAAHVFDGMLSGSKQYISCDATTLPCGMYIATLTTETGVSTAKIIIR